MSTSATAILGAPYLKRVLKALTDFGYKVTFEDVCLQASKALSSQPVDVGPGMMIRDMLKEEGWIK